LAAVSVDLNMKRITNDVFVEKAKKLEPKLMEKQVKTINIVSIGKDGKVEPIAEIGEIERLPLKKGESIVLDFGDHHVGYVSLKLKSVGSPQDAPAYLRLKFGEVSKEIMENSE